MSAFTLSGLTALCAWRDQFREPTDDIEALLSDDYMNRHTICLAYNNKNFLVSPNTYQSVKNAYRYAKYALIGEDYADEPFSDDLRKALLQARDHLKAALRVFLETELQSIS